MEIEVGDRVDTPLGKGTVRYIGPIYLSLNAFTYLGIELDEAVGYTDGTVGLFRYFECSDKHGLFLPLRCYLLGLSETKSGISDTVKKLNSLGWSGSVDEAVSENLKLKLAENTGRVLAEESRKLGLGESDTSKIKESYERLKASIDKTQMEIVKLRKIAEGLEIENISKENQVKLRNEERVRAKIALQQYIDVARKEKTKILRELSTINEKSLRLEYEKYWREEKKLLESIRKNKEKLRGIVDGDAMRKRFTNMSKASEGDKTEWFTRLFDEEPELFEFFNQVKAIRNDFEYMDSDVREALNPKLSRPNSKAVPRMDQIISLILSSVPDSVANLIKDKYLLFNLDENLSRPGNLRHLIKTSLNNKTDMSKLIPVPVKQSGEVGSDATARFEIAVESEVRFSEEPAESSDNLRVNSSIQSERMIDRVQSASINKMLDIAVGNYLNAAEFPNFFLAVFPMFMTPNLLLVKLKEVFDYLEDPKCPQDEDAIRKYRLRVISLIRKWVDNYFTDFMYEKDEESSLLNGVTEFVAKRIVPVMNTLGSDLLRKIEKRKLNPEKNLVPHKSLETPPPPFLKDNKMVFAIDFTLDVLDEREVARQMAIFFQNLFFAIPSREYLEIIKSSGRTPRINNMRLYHDRLVSYVITSIVTLKSVKERAERIEGFISLMEQCKKLNNLVAIHAIIEAIESDPVSRLNYTTSAVAKKSWNKFQDIQRNLERNNMIGYREHLKKSVGPVVPYLEVFVRSLLKIDKTNQNFIRIRKNQKLVNLTKWRLVYKILEEIRSYRGQVYPYLEIYQIQKLLRKMPDLNLEAAMDESFKREPKGASRESIIF